MWPLMVGWATSGARGALNFGEQAVSRMIMQIGSHKRLPVRTRGNDVCMELSAVWMGNGK